MGKIEYDFATLRVNHHFNDQSPREEMFKAQLEELYVQYLREKFVSDELLRAVVGTAEELFAPIIPIIEGNQVATIGFNQYIKIINDAKEEGKRHFDKSILELASSMLLPDDVIEFRNYVTNHYQQLQKVEKTNSESARQEIARLESEKNVAETLSQQSLIRTDYDTFRAQSKIIDEAKREIARLSKKINPNIGFYQTALTWLEHVDFNFKREWINAGADLTGFSTPLATIFDEDLIFGHKLISEMVRGASIASGIEDKNQAYNELQEQTGRFRASLTEHTGIATLEDINDARRQERDGFFVRTADAALIDAKKIIDAHKDSGIAYAQKTAATSIARKSAYCVAEALLEKTMQAHRIRLQEREATLLGVDSSEVSTQSVAEKYQTPSSQFSYVNQPIVQYMEMLPTLNKLSTLTVETQVAK